MKFAITDRFLWMIYNFFEKTGEILEPPEIFRVRGLRDMIPAIPGEREFWRNLERKKRRRRFAQFVNHLKRRGYIKIDSLKEKRGILLTQKGAQKILRIKYKIKTGHRKRKDKKWIMVVFDIPENKRKYRDEFRGFLISLGFQNFQKSIWVSPYDITEDLEKIIKTYSLDKFVKIFLIEEVEIQPPKENKKQKNGK